MFRAHSSPMPTTSSSSVAAVPPRRTPVTEVMTKLGLSINEAKTSVRQDGPQGALRLPRLCVLLEPVWTEGVAEEVEPLGARIAHEVLVSFTVSPMRVITSVQHRVAPRRAGRDVRITRSSA